jgi:hypothetical protein
MDAMYIIPKYRPGPHDDAHLIYFLGVTKFGHQGAKKLFFWALAQLTDKINPMYIIPKDRPEPHDDACVICYLGVTKFVHQGAKKLFFGSSSAHRQDRPQVYYTKITDYLDILETF